MIQEKKQHNFLYNYKADITSITDNIKQNKKKVFMFIYHFQ